MVIDIKPKTRFSLPSIHQRVSVTFNYSVEFTHNLFHLDNPLLARVIADDGETTPTRAIAIIDSGLLLHHPDLIPQLKAYSCKYQKILCLRSEPLLVPGGEAAKNNPQLVEQIHAIIDKERICRHSYVLAIGGGAVLDLVGYAAATAHRGIRIIRIPTTVLAQNDSGVGVKNGINAFGKKNFIGCFAPPYAVLNDFEFLKTLDDRDWRSGVAEAVKVALIKDGDFFEFIADQAGAIANRNMSAMQSVIFECAKLHLQHIATSGDPFEMGSSRPLDFGHWAAHKLEQLTNYSLRHGEAVAIGIALDTTYSYLLGMLSRHEWEKILHTLATLGFQLSVPELTAQLSHPEHPQSIFRGLSEFQEHLGGELTLTLLQKIGKGVEIHSINLSLYKNAIFLLTNGKI